MKSEQRQKTEKKCVDYEKVVPAKVVTKVLPQAGRCKDDNTDMNVIWTKLALAEERYVFYQVIMVDTANSFKGVKEHKWRK